MFERRRENTNELFLEVCKRNGIEFAPVKTMTALSDGLSSITHSFEFGKNNVERSDNMKEVKKPAAEIQVKYNYQILTQAISEINKARIELDKALFTMSAMPKRKRKGIKTKPLIEDYVNTVEQLCWYEKEGLISAETINELFWNDIKNIVISENFNFTEEKYPNIDKFYFLNFEAPF